jgi:hypothetical protein
MRTTLTLDDDVAAGIEKLRAGQGKPLKTVVNDVLRRGLATMMQVRESRVEYRTRPLKTGRCRLPNLDDISEALDVAEGDKRP